jgi:hypothetical protein
VKRGEARRDEARRGETRRDEGLGDAHDAARAQTGLACNRPSVQSRAIHRSSGTADRFYGYASIDRSTDPSTRYYMPPRIRRRAPRRVFLRVYPSAWRRVLNLWYLRYRRYGLEKVNRGATWREERCFCSLDQFRARCFVPGKLPRDFPSISIMNFHGNGGQKCVA